MLVVIAAPIAGLYVIDSFVYPSPAVRIVLRSAPVLPFAIWTLWFDRSRPLESWSPAIRLAARLALLLAIMVFAIALLGLFINWLYDPNRVI